MPFAAVYVRLFILRSAWMGYYYNVWFYVMALFIAIVTCALRRDNELSTSNRGLPLVVSS
jgi:hypothetical protein